MSALLDKTIAIGFLIAVAFTALAFGTVEAWSAALFELIVISLMFLWAIKSVLDKKLKITIPAAILPLAAFLLLGLAQSFAVTNGSGQRVSLSMDVDATRRAVTVGFFLLLSFLVVSNFFSDRERLRKLVYFLAIYGLAMAVFALIQRFTWDGRFYWIRPTERVLIFGPFVNRNHFAGYMEMLIPLPIAMIATRAARGAARLFFGFASVAMGIALLMSLSRGGIISMIAGLMFVVFMKPRRKSDHSESAIASSSRLARLGAVATIAIAMVIGSVWIGAGSLMDRLEESVHEVATESSSRYDRQWLWKDAFSVFLSHPFTGAGLNTFETVYPAHSSGDGSHEVAHAHNDYLQVLTDAGIVGGALALWFIVIIFRAIVKGLKSSDPLMAGIALGGGAGIFSLLVHSFFDFNLQLPSNALLFLALSAAVSQVAAIAGKSEVNGQGSVQVAQTGLSRGVKSW